MCAQDASFALKFAFQLLASIPSVVFGLWGIEVVIPLVVSGGAIALLLMAGILSDSLVLRSWIILTCIMKRESDS